jgi:DNA helicase-2/ATP-dependent DNA helicase PcrA
MSAHLNTEQLRAVTHGTGPVLIVAGPGTGKTKTLTARIVHLVQEKQVDPGKILALTFTNKAAREMEARLSVQLPAKHLPLVATFHALAYKLVPSLKDIPVISDADRAIVLKELHKQGLGGKASAKDLGMIITKAKAAAEPPANQQTKELLAAYNKALAAHGVCDFDDLLNKLRDFLEEESTPFEYVLVDEFQDTNPLQYQLLRLLRTNNLFAIGDPLQSIYGFRGASSDIFDTFKRDLPATVEIRLLTNYRSVSQVVKLAGAIFPNEPPLAAYRSEEGSVAIIETLNEYGEADWIVRKIEGLIGGSNMIAGSSFHSSDKQRSFKDIAVLYRTHASGRQLQRALEKSGIPYQIAGDGSPYLLPEVQAILMAMNHIADHEGTELTIYQLAHKLSEQYKFELKGTLLQFVNGLVRYANMPLTDFMQHVQQIAEQEYYDPIAEAVTLMTIHASKGLEFSQVFVVGAEQGTIPLIRHNISVDLEEEKRLLYVATTRARDNLYLVHARNRGGKQQQLSDFIAKLPPSLTERSIDPGLVGQLRSIERRNQKRAQGSLF